VTMGTIISSRRLGNLLLRQLEGGLPVTLLVASLVMILSLICLGRSEAAQDQHVNCNDVMPEERCACNERVLHALARIRPGVPDPQESGSPVEIHSRIAMQQVRLQRLRTFHAPACSQDPTAPEFLSSPDLLPLAEPHVTSPSGEGTIKRRLRPMRTEKIEPDQKKLPAALTLLVGRWEGWQTLFGGTKPTPLALHVISLGNPIPLRPAEVGPFVKVCSDQGMVFGQLQDGYLELPRSDSSGGAYSIRLWKSLAPHSRDLEGVILLEVRPGEVIVAGLVWLSRAVKFDWTSPPSSYFCQDRDLEEQRKNTLEYQQSGGQESGGHDSRLPQ